jgi:hypothetical protein
VTPPNRRVLTALAWLNVAVHVAGLAFAAVGMRPGSALVGLPERRAYLATFPPGWCLGWGVWMLCALALVAFFAVLARRLPEYPDLAGLAVLLAAAGAAVDLFCDAINITVLPRAAAETEPALFLLIDRVTFAGGLIVANGLYSIATLLLTIGLARRPGMPRVVPLLGWGVFVFGMVMVVAGFADSARLAELATGPTIILFCAWAVVVARALERPGGEP